MGEQVLESSGGATFDGGIYCATTGRNRYIYGGSRSLVMPMDGSDVEVWGGFATQYGQVEITSKFLLTSAGSIGASNSTKSV